MRKVLFILLVMLLVFYAPAELTRLIIYAFSTHPDMTYWFTFELAFMWSFYLAAIPVLWFTLSRAEGSLKW